MLVYWVWVKDKSQLEEQLLYIKEQTICWAEKRSQSALPQTAKEGQTKREQSEIERDGVCKQFQATLIFMMLGNLGIAFSDVVVDGS